MKNSIIKLKNEFNEITKLNDHLFAARNEKDDEDDGNNEDEDNKFDKKLNEANHGKDFMDDFDDKFKNKIDWEDKITCYSSGGQVRVNEWNRLKIGMTKGWVFIFKMYL